jgi:hypothetical protein
MSALGDRCDTLENLGQSLHCLGDGLTLMVTGVKSVIRESLLKPDEARDVHGLLRDLETIATRAGKLAGRLDQGWRETQQKIADIYAAGGEP